LKILSDLADARHSREIDDCAFVAPKRAGMACADNKKKNRCHEKENRHDPFRALQEI